MSAYKLKVTLKGIKPFITRTIAVPKDVTFADLHKIIQTAMGWKDEHLHEFVIKDDGTRIVPGDTDESELGLKCAFEEVTPLSKYAGRRIKYTYDSMSEWVHHIRFLKDLDDYTDNFPKVVKYQNDCPPEESGGSRGFLEKLDIMEDYLHPDYEYVIDWFNEEYLQYDVDEVNEALRNMERASTENVMSTEEIEEIMTAFLTDIPADFYYDLKEKKARRDHDGRMKDEPERYLMIRTSKAQVLNKIMTEFAAHRNSVKDAKVLGYALSSRSRRLDKFNDAVRRLGYEKEWRYVLRSTCFTVSAEWARMNGFVAPKDAPIELLAKWMMED